MDINFLLFQNCLMLLVYYNTCDTLEMLSFSTFKAISFQADLSNDSLVLMNLSSIKSHIICSQKCSGYDSCLSIGYGSYGSESIPTITLCSLLRFKITNSNFYGYPQVRFWNKQVLVIFFLCQIISDIG